MTASDGTPGASADERPVVRRMGWWDIGAAAALEREAFPEDAWSAETFWSELAERDTRSYVVAEDGAGIVAYTGVAVVGPAADLQTLTVASAARRRGIGRLLLAHAVALARARGARRMFLEVRADNTAAIGLYEGTGWRITGRRSRYYQGPDGTRVDALLMTRTLDP